MIHLSMPLTLGVYASKIRLWHGLRIALTHDRHAQRRCAHGERYIEWHTWAATRAETSDRAVASHAAEDTGLSLQRAPAIVCDKTYAVLLI